MLCFCIFTDATVAISNARRINESHHHHACWSCSWQRYSVCRGTIGGATVRAYKNTITLHLPYPPSANHYKGRNTSGNRKTDYITKEALAYIQEVGYAVPRSMCISTPCRQVIMANPPDRRKRDVCNLEKVMNDALVKAGFLKDDKLIYDHRAAWWLDDAGDPIVEKGGACEVTFEW
jgi:crossover junction endodeoxyribonuclease RusA